MRLLGACLLTATVALGTTASAPAAAHSLHAEPGSHGVEGMSELELRSFETEVFGPEHAAEHARQRTAIVDDPTPTPQTLSAAETAAPPDPATSGEWAAPFAIPVMGINAVMLPTGKVMWWSYPRNPSQDVGDPDAPNTAQAWLWNPVTGAQTRIDPPLWHDPADPPGVLKPANIWCSGQSLLSDGRVLVTGGNLAYDGDGDDYKGLNKVYTFNPWNETWTEQPDMRHGRWYPSQVLLPDGRTAIMSGFDESGGGYSSTNKEIEIFTPSPNLDGRGTLSLLGTRGGTGAPPDGGLYPHTFVMPSGRVMVAGPDPNDSWFLRDPGPTNTFAWDNFTGLNNQRLWGTGVLLPGGPNGSTKVQLIGGSNLATSPLGVATSSTIDEATGGVTTGPSMNIGRSHHNTVLLPDGSMVTVGGGVGKRAPQGQWAADPEQRQVELFDPATDLWRLGAAQAESRAYHSTAILMPDGRVISAGDDYNGGIDQDTAEIYSPPYLFKGPRPTITAAPSSVELGQAFSVSTPNTDIAKAVLVAPGATTHSVDMNQRLVGLTMTERAGAVDLISPPNGNVAPPGWYMLFLLNDAGVPSVAKFVRVLPSNTSPPPPPTGLVAAYSFDQGSGTSVPDASGNANNGTLTGGTAWTAAGRNGGALNFDGTNDRVDVPDSSSLDLSRMTLEAWVKPDTLGGYRTLLLKETSSYLAYALYGGTTSSNRPAIEANRGELIGGTALALNSWTHIAGTYDGTTLRIYVNGTLATSKSTTQTIPNSSNPLYIGGNMRWGEFFDGTIDDVRVYDRALSQAEIQADRDTPVGDGTPPPPQDTTPPTVSITAPANGATVSGSNVSVTANASDTGGSGLVGVQFKRGSTNIGAEDTSAPYAANFDSTQLPNGNQQLTAIARDAAGNLTTSTTITINVQNSTPPPPPTGLVAAYSFDQGSGTSVPDASGNANNGTLTGGTAWTAAGRNGGALNFDGTNDRVDVPDSSSLDLSRMTLEAWVKPDTLGGYRTLLLKETSSYLAYALYGGTTSSNRPAIEANRGELIGGTALALNSWTHIAGTYDGTTLRIYVNGTLATSKSTTQTIPNSSNPLYIGGNMRWGEFFDGTIDDVRVYDRALSQAEIQADRDTPVGDGTPPPPQDTTPPTVSITAPANGATVSGSNVSVTANASDTGGSGLVGVQFKRGSTNIGAEDTSAPYAANFDSTQLPNGNQQLTAIARDAAGNLTTSTTITINVQNSTPPPPPTGLVAAYSFNEGFGIAAPDSSGRGNTGSITGATWGAGRYGGGLIFDGVNDRIAVPDSPFLDLTTAMTIEAWVRPTTLGGYRTAVIKETATYLAYALYAGTTSSNRPAIEANRGELIGGTAPALNTWTHVTGTYDGASLRLYINGALVSTKATTQLMPNSADALYIGGNAGWGEWFDGTIDEVRIYNRALSLSEIQADRETGIPLATP